MATKPTTKKPIDPFAAIAQKSAPSTPKAKNKVIATVTNEIRNDVDLFVQNKAEIARITAEKDAAEERIIDHVRAEQDALGRSGNFTKSLQVLGNTSDVLYSTSDRFSTPKDEEAQEAIEKLLGKERYEDWFETRRVITLKKEAAEDQDFLQKLMKLVAAAGMSLGEVFNVVDTLMAKPDLDRKQYELSEEDLAVFRTLVRQNKPALK